MPSGEALDTNITEEPEAIRWEIFIIIPSRTLPSPFLSPVFSKNGGLEALLGFLR